MSNAKVALIVDEALKREACERLADRDAMFATIENEIDDLRQLITREHREVFDLIYVMLERIEKLEAGVVPDTSA